MTRMSEDQFPEATEASFSGFLEDPHGIQLPVFLDAYNAVPVSSLSPDCTC